MSNISSVEYPIIASGLLCQGQQLDCTGGNTNSSIIDPDIAGWGVLASFIVTALATVCAIHIGYITDSLGDASLNQLDVLALAKFRKWLRLKRLPPVLSASEKAAKEVRTEAFMRFILALSDQQLVTGFAILVASFALRCTISGLNFEIAGCLAWFSSMTHLATLSVLQLYLRARPWMRGVRIVGMLAVLILLIASFLVAIIDTDLVDPIQCLFEKQLTDANDEIISFTTLSNNFYAAWLLLYLLVAFGNKVTSLYVSDATTTLRGGLLEFLEKRSQLESKASYQQEAIRAMDNAEMQMSLWQDITKHFKLFVFFFQELLNSYLWQLIFAYFGFSYGIIQLFTITVNGATESAFDLWVYSDLPNFPSFSFGSTAFGQLVPLLLLVFPILAALEVYEDVRLSRRSKSSMLEAQDRASRLPTKCPHPSITTSLSKDPLFIVKGVGSLEYDKTANMPVLHGTSSFQKSENYLAKPDIAICRHVNNSPPNATLSSRHSSMDDSVEIKCHYNENCTSEIRHGSKARPSLDQIRQVYRYKYAKATIGTLIFLSYGGFTTFSFLLAGLVPMDSISPIILTAIWVSWYMSGFLSLAWRYGYRKLLRPRSTQPTTLEVAP